MTRIPLIIHFPYLSINPIPLPAEAIWNHTFPIIESAFTGPIFPERLSHYYVKRVAAEPGDTVVIREGVLYVNSVPYTKAELDKIADPGILENELTLEKDEYFVIGDNINNSEDSRSGNIGPVKADSIIGKGRLHGNTDNAGLHSHGKHQNKRHQNCRCYEKNIAPYFLHQGGADFFLFLIKGQPFSIQRRSWIKLPIRGFWKMN